MKRSEMVRILQEATVEHLNCVCCNTDEEMYSKILKKLEDNGMKNPIWIREVPPFSHDTGKDIKAFYDIQEGWEPE